MLWAVLPALRPHLWDLPLRVLPRRPVSPVTAAAVAFVCQNVALLEEEADINQLTEFFSYEHFYVIYCKFWELDTDHDLLIDPQDLARHNDHGERARGTHGPVLAPRGLTSYSPAGVPRRAIPERPVLVGHAGRTVLVTRVPAAGRTGPPK